MENQQNIELWRIVEQLKSKRIIKRDIEISEKTGYARSTVANYLNGKVRVSDEFM